MITRILRPIVDRVRYYRSVVRAVFEGPEALCATLKNPPDWLTPEGRAARRASVDAKIAELEKLIESGR